MKKNRPTPGIVSLITDFGFTDAYVGQLKGALLSKENPLTIIDITHDIRPQDIEQAAYELFSSYKHFPAGTVHVIVVDPGVGTERDILAVKANDHFFIAPDNGILSLFLEADLIEQVIKLHFDNSNISSTTFHGRDIMAPVAALIAGGEELESFGVTIQKDECILTPFRRIDASENSLQGKVLRIDHFGNIRTSIQKSDLVVASKATMRVALRGQYIHEFIKTYGDKPEGSLCCLFDSDGFLEVALTNGNAAEALQVTIGDKVVLFF